MGEGSRDPAEPRECVRLPLLDSISCRATSRREPQRLGAQLKLQGPNLEADLTFSVEISADHAGFPGRPRAKPWVTHRPTLQTAADCTCISYDLRKLRISSPPELYNRGYLHGKSFR